MSGCASVFSNPQPVRDEVYVHIKLVDSLPYGKYGVASCSGGSCDIQLRRDSYPYCLLHELRHPFEGDFHGDRHSIEDCQLR